MPRRLHRVGAALALACAGAALHAQTPPAGNPLERLPAPAPIPGAAAPAPRLDTRTPEGAAAAGLARRFTPRRFDIEGVNALPFADIAKRFSPLANQEVSVAQLVAAAQAGTALYREQGHPLSFVYLPAQSFENGVVRVVAVEGYVAEVRIEGEAGPVAGKVREIAEGLTKERPLTQKSFERVTQLLMRLPGLSVAANAAMPSTTSGATTLVLQVKRVPYNVSVGADIRQPRARAVLSGVWTDPVVPGSELSASTLAGDFRREKLLTLGYSQFVGNDGLAFKLGVSDYRGYPDPASGRGATLERYNTNRRLDLAASYPLLLNARSSLMLSGGLYAVDNVDTYSAPASGGWLAEDTRVRALFAQLAYTDATPERSRTASVLFAQGIDGLGASAVNRSNIAGLSGANAARTSFSRVAVDAAQRDRFAGGWGTGFSFGGQYGTGPLASSERISFGGARFGRGYAAGDAAGDSGWGVGAELNKVWRTDFAWLKQVEPYVLLEAAGVSTRQGQPSPQKLGSFALGVRLSDARHYSLDLAVAKPTGDAAASNPQRKPRLSLMLSYQLASPS
ncbi:ShlB/FhaC/HecB family hemolysin secretion/activation protein [Variovorax sp. KK3]|uniref:ShlB/FhaC/HecB family hemolysin secretion/activation protein n=1 Tax=Variovorax sp. KK3 TaxID=1855728 RepID=UPI00097C2CCA|nr:POTRA domain-containing protein [Variovorax sp. KK3]